MLFCLNITRIPLKILQRLTSQCQNGFPVGWASGGTYCEGRDCIGGKSRAGAVLGDVVIVSKNVGRADAMVEAGCWQACYGGGSNTTDRRRTVDPMHRLRAWACFVQS